MPATIPPPILRPRDATLVCETCRDATRHEFARHQRVGEYGAYAQVFRCKPCGAERRFGLLV